MKTLAHQTALAAAVLSACILSACAPKFEPPPGYVGGFLTVGTDRSRTILVQPEDTLYIISRRYGVPTKAIIARNGLTAPYALRVGQTLILDAAQHYTVARGDNLTKIAGIYGIEVSVLADANDL
ncbi:MAG: LysM peptidoglycan-binding domain-containing protein, partial [Rhizobiaceae bacterium]|nr:LysM peptidoglycan-binding domain-containing protein [Rhizobiaceae bacterium]